MSSFFSYSVDGDTMRSCLDLIDRAAQRQERGEPGYIGHKHVRGRQRVKSSSPRASRVSPERLALGKQVLALLAQGLSRREIGAKLDVREGVLDKILYQKSKWMKGLR